MKRPFTHSVADKIQRFNTFMFQDVLMVLRLSSL